MIYEYPFTVEEAEAGRFVAQSVDVPEAITQGDNFEDCLVYAQEALVVALDFYVCDNQPIPSPSKPKSDQQMIPLPVSVAAKVTIYQALREQKLSKTDLANRTGLTRQNLGRITDLRISTHFSTLEKILVVLGKKASLKVVSN